MPRKEARTYKALYFDMRIKALKQYYSCSNPKGAYLKIQNFLVGRNFSHVQYSGYHSIYRTTDLEIFDLIREMDNTFPWLQYCMNRFEVTNIGANHDLMGIFEEKTEEPELLVKQ